MSQPRDLVRISDFEGLPGGGENNPVYDAFMAMCDAFGKERVREMSHYSLFLCGRQLAASKEEFYQWLEKTKAELEEAIRKAQKDQG